MSIWSGRFIARLTIAIAVLVALVGCGISTSSGSSDVSSSPASASPTKTQTKMQKLGAELRAGPAKDVPTAADFGSFPAFVSRVPTTDRVVFMTIDDGYYRNPGIATLLKNTGLPITSFLTANTVAGHTDYFAQISKLDGQVIQNHSRNHPQMPNLSESGQREQICYTSDKLQEWFGTRPWMFRPPYGEYNDTTKRAAKSCGIDYLVNWRVSLPADLLEYAEPGRTLKPGDIILTHWRDDLPIDLLRTFNEIKRQGFKVGALQDYLRRR